MTYEQASDWIAHRVRKGEKPALDRIQKLMSKLGNPQDKLKFVHVAGTNGKGTTCTLTASALRESGLKVGLYTSPYVLNFRERFQINGEMISEEKLAEITTYIAPIAEELSGPDESIGHFEFITALAFVWFLEEKCDIVVLEVGIGGRFDATNVIKQPEAAVIMSISMDHTEMLGDTVGKIAFEKAGIIKSQGDVVLYPVQEESVHSVIETACKERSANLIIPDLKTLKIEKEELAGTHFMYKGKELFTPFMGRHQVYNAITAYEALGILKQKGFPLTDESIRTGFAKAFIPARMEILSQTPLLLLDGGHNAGFAEALKQVLLHLPHEQKVAAVFGMMRDKDSRTALSILAPLFDRMIMTAPDMPRAAEPELLQKEAEGLCGDIIVSHTQEETLKRIEQARKENFAVVVCGSFYLAAELRKSILKNLNKT